jgi:hypothetical protein
MIGHLSLLLVCIIIGVFRVLGLTHIAYQAVAHCVVGGLIGAYIVLRKHEDEVNRRRYYLSLAILLTVLETACFVYFRVLGH